MSDPDSRLRRVIPPLLLPITPVRVVEFSSKSSKELNRATPAPKKVIPVLHQDRKVLSFARWSRAVLPVFSTVSAPRSPRVNALHPLRVPTGWAQHRCMTRFIPVCCKIRKEDLVSALLVRQAPLPHEHVQSALYRFFHGGLKTIT